MTTPSVSKSQLAVQRAYNREHYPCEIKGCTRTRHTGSLCKRHYELVPRTLRTQCAVEVMRASFNMAREHHKRQLALVRALLAERGES